MADANARKRIAQRIATRTAGVCDGAGAIFDAIGTCSRCVCSYDRHLLREAAALLNADEGEQAKPINAIAAAHIRRFKACEVVPTAPCCERDGKQHPQYDALHPRHWCDSCLAATYADRLLSQLVASKAPSLPAQAEEIARLKAAARVALDEMCRTVAPRNSFTDAVDALDAALGTFASPDPAPAQE